MFVPTGGPAIGALEQDMREHLASSLERIGEMARPVLTEDVGIGAALEHIRRHRIEPGVFALYYELVFNLQGADYPAARRNWREIAGRADAPAELEVLPFRPEALGEDAARFGRLLAIGAAKPPIFRPPPAGAWAAFQHTSTAALALLEEANPAWAEEVRGLMSRLIATVPAPPDEGAFFSGGSSALIWGAILVNVEEYRDRLGVLVVITHEAAHLLLLGLAREQDIVTNPVEERYSTELRPTPRPMIALYHSTFVSARTALLCRYLAATGPGVLSTEERQSVLQMERMQLQRFAQGHEIIDRHALLTPLGRTLIDEARSELAGA